MAEDERKGEGGGGRGRGAPYLVEPRRVEEGVSSETRPERQQQKQVSIQSERSRVLCSSYPRRAEQDEVRARGSSDLSSCARLFKGRSLTAAGQTALPRGTLPPKQRERAGRDALDGNVVLLSRVDNVGLGHLGHRPLRRADERPEWFAPTGKRRRATGRDRRKEGDEASTSNALHTKKEVGEDDVRCASGSSSEHSSVLFWGEGVGWVEGANQPSQSRSTLATKFDRLRSWKGGTLGACPGPLLAISLSTTLDNLHGD